jgi:hypothetical protein
VSRGGTRHEPPNPGDRSRPPGLRLERGMSRTTRQQSVALRASVGSTDASASLPARVGVVGPTRATTAGRMGVCQRLIVLSPCCD